MLSKKTKYGIKALTFLARQEDQTPVAIADIAKSENISIKFLESILLLLRHSGFLGAKKGKGGGYYLIKDPKDINMAHVYRILEGPIALLPCASHNFYEKCDGYHYRDQFPTQLYTAGGNPADYFQQCSDDGRFFYLCIYYEI